ncbi:hypothetical protein BUALT_Bualt08G0056600 [Buddleja alternifolia]|uniref:Uncharacterized protein n=1 Tax=Buddleja alternifolia TaxID=168488 RepID=A0AAV6X3G2_9LAMI|nr:hypothetical protein BUALT_Bualt08G0056600 [Buddleja alternifolia]
MATPSDARAVKSLNKSFGRRRFVINILPEESELIAALSRDLLGDFVMNWSTITSRTGSYQSMPLAVRGKLRGYFPDDL